MLRVVQTASAGEDTTPEEALAAPAFTWEELEEALTAIAASAQQREMTPALVAATRRRAPSLPRSQALREILSLAWVIADESVPATEAGA